MGLCFSEKENLAKALAQAFDGISFDIPSGTIELSSGANYTDCGWECNIVPEKNGEYLNGHGGPSDKKEAEELDNAAEKIYEKLRILLPGSGFDYALIGTEVGEWRSVDELCNDFKDDWDRLSGLVVSEDLFNRIGRPEEFVKFSDGCYWQPWESCIKDLRPRKPIKPKMPKVPDILKGMHNLGWGEPEEYFEEILYETPTNFEIEYEKFLTDRPDSSNEEVAKYFSEEFNWDVEFNEKGSIRQVDGERMDNCPNDYIKNAHRDSGSKPLSLTDILSKVSPEDYQWVRIVGVSYYKGDYIWGDPGVKVFILRKNPNYDEQVKANKKYKQQLKEYSQLDRQYVKDLKEYDEQRQAKIDAKIREMEKSGEL